MRFFLRRENIQTSNPIRIRQKLPRRNNRNTQQKQNIHSEHEPQCFFSPWWPCLMPASLNCSEQYISNRSQSNKWKPVSYCNANSIHAIFLLYSCCYSHEMSPFRFRSVASLCSFSCHKLRRTVQAPRNYTLQVLFIFCRNSSCSIILWCSFHIFTYKVFWKFSIIYNYIFLQ